MLPFTEAVYRRLECRSITNKLPGSTNSLTLVESHDKIIITNDDRIHKK